MLSHKLETYKGTEENQERSLRKDFDIEVHKDFVTVSRKLQNHSNMLQSRTFRVEKDVLVEVSKTNNDLYTLECAWLWREPTIFNNLSFNQADELKQVVDQIAQTKRSLDMHQTNLKGIKVGNQIWCDQNINIDIGAECAYPLLKGNKVTSFGRLYTYEGVEQVNALYKKWRVPTEQDYLELFSFLAPRAWKELTQNMQFLMSGFRSKRLKDDLLDKFLEQNKALRVFNGGFYWTSEITKYSDETDRPLSRKYLQLNKLNNKISFEESQCANRNMLSLRLIRDY
ncbi:MAG: hypothetical protein JJ895_01840 [Balneolaceae bacterium]|nr:hypothetical protein [Balneolaceae bacterium]